MICRFNLIYIIGTWRLGPLESQERTTDHSRPAPDCSTGERTCHNDLPDTLGLRQQSVDPKISKVVSQ